MAFTDLYRKQVALLIEALPFIAKEKCFALKGGTAINLFIRDMPRLSIDIDLTYLPVESREASLAAIDGALKRIAADLRKGIKNSRLFEGKLEPEQKITKLVLRVFDVQMMIEVTPVIRGCVFEPEVRGVSPAVEEAFGFAEFAVVSFADLYGGKIIAALDRQHPRDLFDIRELLANEGIDDALRQTFIVNLLSHNRPMSEVLAPTRKDISQEFARGFQGMTAKPVALDELLRTREELIKVMVAEMPDAHRRFLISFERGAPDWPLLGVEGAAELPAVKRRQQNLDRMKADERAALVARLEEVLRRGQLSSPS
jgi:predicted nucleotidyltransferase component of viral defense system